MLISERKNHSDMKPYPVGRIHRHDALQTLNFHAVQAFVAELASSGAATPAQHIDEAARNIRVENTQNMVQGVEDIVRGQADWNTVVWKGREHYSTSNSTR